MVDPINIYISRLAEAARKKCCEKKFIEEKTFKFEEHQLESIVSFFGGELRHYETESEMNNIVSTIKGNSFLKKISNDRIDFIIGYIKFFPIDILHELGHYFLEKTKLKSGDIVWSGDLDDGICELTASKFARAFVMPSKLFEEVIVINSNKGLCDIQEVAKTFGVEISDVISRGRETYLWE